MANGQEKLKLPTYETLLAEVIKNLAIDSGVVGAPVAQGGNALTDETKGWANDIHKNRLVKIITGVGSGQQAVIAGNAATTLCIRGNWARNIGAGAFYVILGMDVAQALRDVFGGGSDISAANPLEVHDPTIEDVEGKLDHPDHGLAALKAMLDSLAGGTALYGSYGPRNVEVGNDVDFGIILYDPSGNIITTGEITPGTYTIHRIRDATDTEIVGSTALSEAVGRVYMTYNFPAANWAVGDIFYIIFSDIIVTREGVTTEYPNLYIWGRVVREAAIQTLVGTNTDAAGTTTIFARLRQIVDTYLADGTIGLAAIEALVDNLETDLQVRTIQSGIKAINAAATKYLHIDSGTNGAEILSITIEGVIGHDWTLDIYVPAADAEAATQAKSKRDAITYAAADTEGGLLGPFGIPFDCYLDFTNNGANDQIDQVTITYRSRGVLTLTWEA